MMATIPRPRRAAIVFGDAQRQRLTNLGLSTGQVAELERVVLPFIRAWLSEPPTMQDVRKPLAKLRDHVATASKLLTSMIVAASTDGRAEMANAGNNLLVAASDCETPPENLEALASAMGELAKWCDGAILPLKPKRSNAGHWLPVARIWESLVRSHGSKRMTLRLSSSEGSAFREICGICYDVITGGRDADPVRAIRAYIAIRQKRDNAQRAENGIQVLRRVVRQHK